jgi:hypothetical protein
MNTSFFAQVYLKKEPPKRADGARKMIKIEEDRLSRVGAISLQTHVLVASSIPPKGWKRTGWMYLFASTNKYMHTFIQQFDKR